MLCHDSGLLEVSLEFFEPLDAPVSNFTSLLRVEHGPLTPMEFPIEIQDEVVVHEVHKGVTHIRLVLVVYRHVEEVVLPLVVLVDLLKKQALIVLVRYVFDHYCGSRVFPTLYPLYIHPVHQRLLLTITSPTRVR